MKSKKYNRYRRIKKTLIAGASTGIVAGMILMGGARTAIAETSDFSVPAYSQNGGPTGMHIMHRWNSRAKIGSLAKGLGLNRNQVKDELKSGKHLKQILQENGIVPDQLQKAFKNSKKRKL